MKHLQKVVMLCAFFVLASCAATRPLPPEVKLPPERIVQNGYSLMPLNEPGWMIGKRDKYQSFLVKLGANPDETFAIQGMMSKLTTFNTNAEFVQLVKEGQVKDKDAQRFKIISHEVTSFPMAGIECAKSHMIIEDHAAVKRTNDSRDMILEVLTLSCAHPSEKSVGVHGVYSHRHYPGQEDPAFIEKGMNVLNSVELFTPDEPYITATQKSGLKFADNFSTFCSNIIEQPLPPLGEASKENDPPPLQNYLRLAYRLRGKVAEIK